MLDHEHTEAQDPPLWKEAPVAFIVVALMVGLVLAAIGVIIRTIFHLLFS